jgi:hypothetical protein
MIALVADHQFDQFPATNKGLEFVNEKVELLICHDVFLYRNG